MLRLLLLTYSSNKVQCKRQDDEHQADPLGGLGELGVPGLAFWPCLAEEGVGAAGDGAGEAGALAGLGERR